MCQRIRAEQTLRFYIFLAEVVNRADVSERVGVVTVDVWKTIKVSFLVNTLHGRVCLRVLMRLLGSEDDVSSRRGGFDLWLYL